MFFPQWVVSGDVVLSSSFVSIAVLPSISVWLTSPFQSLSDPIPSPSDAPRPSPYDSQDLTSARPSDGMDVGLPIASIGKQSNPGATEVKEGDLARNSVYPHLNPTYFMFGLRFQKYD